MRPILGGIAVGLLLATPGCSTAKTMTCEHVAVSIASGVRGQPTPQEAITVFLNQGSEDLRLPKGPWTVKGLGRFTNGRAYLTVSAAPSGGYIVEAAATC